MAMAVLQSVMGGNEAGHSLFGSCVPAAPRVVQNRLNARLLYDRSASKAFAFSSVHSDSGLFGFYAKAKPSNSAAVAYALVDEAKRMASGDVTADEVGRAKTQVKHAIAWASDSRAALIETIGCSVGGSGRVGTIAAAAESVDKVTAADVTRVVRTQPLSCPCA
jgi:predicted Zn-dependent peptidase